MSGAIARMGKEEAYKGFWWRNRRERVNLGEPGEDGRIILRCLFRKMDEGVRTGSSWFSWQPIVNAVIKRMVPINAWNSRLPENWLASPDGPCSMEKVIK